MCNGLIFFFFFYDSEKYFSKGSHYVSHIEIPWSGRKTENTSHHIYHNDLPFNDVFLILVAE